MYIILAVCSVILAFLIPAIKGDTSSLNCQDKNFYGGIVMFFLIALPEFLLYLQTTNTPLLKRLEFAEKISKPNSLMYAIQRTPEILLGTSIIFSVIFISLMFSTTCN